MTRNLTLGALVNAGGGHVAGWRHPEAHAAGLMDFDFHVELARTLERGRFDTLFIADALAVWGHQLDSLSRTARAERFEPLTLLAALSTVTSRIGLVATATTTYNEPYHVARKFASLDHLSHGRAGWNIVTSIVPFEAANFGRAEHLEHSLRYRRADEFVDVVRQLWDSELRTPHHEGEHFTVREPRAISRPPQGHPVLFQAGSSDTGRDFAARHGEVLFTVQPELAAAQAYYTDIKARVTKAGRDPDNVLVWPVLSPLVADTETEARQRAAELDELIHDDVARRLIQDAIGDLDLSGHSLDGPVPDIPETNRSKSSRDVLLGLARKENLTIRQLAHRISGGSIVAGTPEQLADRMALWFTEGGADGFNVSFPYLPGPAVDFVEQVVPILRRRGLVPSEYEGGTLRENLGLPSPEVTR
jgi:alkanesulfonate monooxygenase SsuD/methylene tetrahydromethanopterin reductase-like flavin-dependent oxidoreductase (luciferase family)